MTRFWHPFADMAAVSRSELVIDRGEGPWVFDDAGKRYLDATASLWYANIGHGRAEVADAVAAQMRRLEAYSTFGDFGNAPATAVAERLAERAPMDDARVFLASGGGDAIDTAAKIARRHFNVTGHPERTHLIARTQGYHGTHGFGTALGGIEANTTGWGPLVGSVSTVPHDSLPALEQEILRVGPEKVAAFFCEPVIGAGGVHLPPEGYIQGVADLCAEHGILLVIDSVICAFGRLGTWFGVERWPDVRPDLITFAKGVTAGYLPLGGVIASGRVAEPFFGEPGGPMLRHGATYAGHPTVCAAALSRARRLRARAPDRARARARGPARRRAAAARRPPGGHRGARRARLPGRGRGRARGGRHGRRGRASGRRARAPAAGRRRGLAAAGLRRGAHRPDRRRDRRRARPRSRPRRGARS